MLEYGKYNRLLEEFSQSNSICAANRCNLPFWIKIMQLSRTKHFPWLAPTLNNHLAPIHHRNQSFDGELTNHLISTHLPPYPIPPNCTDILYLQSTRSNVSASSKFLSLSPLTLRRIMISPCYTSLWFWNVSSSQSSYIYQHHKSSSREVLTSPLLKGSAQGLV